MKSKGAAIAPARELYISPLWRARRAYAEQSEALWFVLSALHGLVAPEDPLAPYELALNKLPARERGAWAADVVSALESRLGPLEGRAFELHAGGSYRRALEPQLRAHGAAVASPTAQIRGIGAQLAWYRRSATAERRRTATPGDVMAALLALDTEPRILSACGWPADLEQIDSPGMYAWWVDEAGAEMLGRGLEAELAPGRIYVGLTGATKWPSGSTVRSTLRQRVGRNHIRGRIGGSTFRLTLASILRGELALRVTAKRTLEPTSESALTGWIARHLAVAVHPFPVADALADLERKVLARLDPPLNLDERPPSPVRDRLRELRRQLLAVSPEPEVTRLSASIGNGLEGYFVVEGEGTHLSWRGSAADGGPGGATEHVEPPPASWLAFWRALDRIDAWDWDGSNYVTPGVTDGTHWSIDARREGRVVSASGSNGYPDAPGSDPGRRFTEFCRAVSRLAGGRRFR